MSHDIDNENKDGIIKINTHESNDSQHDDKEQIATPIVTGIMVLLTSEYNVKHKKDITEKELYKILKHNTKDLSS